MSQIELIICVLLAILIVSAIGLLILTFKVRDLEARIDFAIHLNCETERNIEKTSDELLKMILDIDDRQIVGNGRIDCTVKTKANNCSNMQQDEDEGRVEAAKQMGFLK